MRLFAARETHIRTSFAHNVYNQNIQADIRNIYHLELIQLFQHRVSAPVWSATTAVVAYTRYCRFAIKIVRLAFQLVSISAITWSSFWHFASPLSAAAVAPLCQIFTMRSFFYTFFSFLLRKFSHALVSFFCFSSFPLTSWHCHLHLRITHARNNKIYLFSLFPSACLTFHRLSLFFSLRLTTVTNELWLVLLDALTLSYSRLLASANAFPLQHTFLISWEIFKLFLHRVPMTTTTVTIICTSLLFWLPWGVP